MKQSYGCRGIGVLVTAMVINNPVTVVATMLLLFSGLTGLVAFRKLF
jgi:hypothetical protein